MLTTRRTARPFGVLPITEETREVRALPGLALPGATLADAAAAFRPLTAYLMPLDALLVFAAPMEKRTHA